VRLGRPHHPAWSPPSAILIFFCREYGDWLTKYAVERARGIYTLKYIGAALV
jgi:hypothetical protein